MSAAGTSRPLRSPRRRSPDEPDGGRPPPGRRRRWPTRLAPLALLVPATVALVGLLGYPLVKLVILSFQDYGTRQLFGVEAPAWIGFDNFRTLLAEDTFVTVTIRTIVMTVILVALTMIIGMATALTMMRLDRVTRTLLSIGMLLAWAIPQVSIIRVFQWMFNGQQGVIPDLLNKLHLIDLTGNNSVFLSGTKTLIVIVFIVVWQAVPFVAITLHAGLSQVPRELYEAARVDGAGPWQAFTRVTLPMLRPIVSLLIVLSLIWDLRLFNQVFVFNGGGPQHESDLLGTFSFAQYSEQEFGQGAAVALVLVAMAMVLTAYHVRRLVKSGEAA